MTPATCPPLLCSLFLAALAAGGCAQQAQICVAPGEDNRIVVSFRTSVPARVAGIRLLRSTTRPGVAEPDDVRMPVTTFELPDDVVETGFQDSFFAHNTTYYYRARFDFGTGLHRWSNIDSVTVPDRELGRIIGSSILVDKRHYFLEARDGGRMMKRYPIALGRDPQRRKLCQDNSTTPEGVYRIANAQPNATFYKAFDLDYPNEVDRARYEFSRAEGLLPAGVSGIGGEIQIHGQGIERNWTSGCVAMRNADIDELFAHQRIGTGVPVTIVGGELGREDISSIQDYRTGREIRNIQEKLRRLGHYTRTPDGTPGRETRLALGRFQRANGLPLTCDLDRRTVALLSRQP